jgi:hypothetical protein
MVYRAKWKLKNGLNIVVSIPAYHAGDPGSIPGNGAKMLGSNLPK